MDIQSEVIITLNMYFGQSNFVLILNHYPMTIFSSMPYHSCSSLSALEYLPLRISTSVSTVLLFQAILAALSLELKYRKFDSSALLVNFYNAAS